MSQPPERDYLFLNEMDWETLSDLQVVLYAQNGVPEAVEEAERRGLGSS